MPQPIPEQIVALFKERVVEESLSKVRISQLIADLGINRNTFYYHFESKFDVALQIYRRDLARELRKTVPEEQLVSGPIGKVKSGAPSICLPYYARIEIGFHALDEGPFLKALARTIESNKPFYAKLFDEKEYEFNFQFCALYYPQVKKDLEFVLGARYLSPEAKRFLSQLGTGQIMQIAHLLTTSNDVDKLLDERVNPFWNFYQEGIQASIRKHPLNRITSSTRRH